MEKHFEEWNGKKFPVREVMFEVCDGMETMVKVADVDMWDAIEDACLIFTDKKQQLNI